MTPIEKVTAIAQAAQQLTTDQSLTPAQHQQASLIWGAANRLISSLSGDPATASSEEDASDPTPPPGPASGGG